MTVLLQDLRDAFRHLRTRPGFTAVVVLTLSMGIGLNAAVFTAVDAALLRSLPYAEPERLVHLFQTNGNQDIARFELAWPTVRELQADHSLFTGVAGYNRFPATWQNGSERSQLKALRVTASFFDVLGVRPQLGRTFRPGEDEDGGPRAVMLGDAFWRTQMGGDTGVLGRTLVLDDQPYTIVGVLPPSFPFAPGADARIYLAMQAKGDLLRRSLNWVNTIARLRDGITLEQARHGARAFSASLREQFPDAFPGVSMEVVPLREVLVGKVEPVLVLLFACVSLVLLVACANVANLLLARARSRERELAVRAALGAGRRRLVRQLLTESLVLATLGGVLGLLAARLSLPLLLAGIPVRERATMPFLEHLDVDTRVLLYGGGLIVLTTLLFGLLPALRASRLNLHDALKDGSGSSALAGSGRHGLQGALVAVEVALAVMLLGSAGLMGKSLLRVLSTDPGYRPEGALGATVFLPAARLEHEEAAVNLQEAIRTAVASIPGVTAVTRVSILPGTGNGNTLRFVREDRPRPTGAPPEVAFREVGPDFFHVLGVPLLGGRGFGPEDTHGSLPVVIVNRTLQRRYFPGEDAVGKRIRPTYSPAAPVLTIVGVVGDQTFGALDEAPPALLYIPDSQSPDNPFSLVLRTARPGVEGEVRRAILAAAPDAAVLPVRSLSEVLADAPSMFLRRYPVFLLGVFAAFALVLAGVGIFGVVSYGVVERTREFGVRMAVGAGRRDIVRLVLRRNLPPVLAGAAAGVLGSVALAVVFRGLLFGVTASDPGVLAGVVVLLGAVALASALFPALRATRVDPATALRST
ncbi:MAG TPA: ABC transporter permease [Myxococcaceae bacterium]|nr:ABC transporter permease [Myxococcaceae bacterium]